MGLKDDLKGLALAWLGSVLESALEHIWDVEKDMDWPPEGASPLDGVVEAPSTKIGVLPISNADLFTAWISAHVAGDTGREQLLEELAAHWLRWYDARAAGDDESAAFHGQMTRRVQVEYLTIEMGWVPWWEE